MVLEEKINALDKEWKAFRSGLDQIQSNLPISGSHNRQTREEANDARIKSEKNKQPRGDISNLYDKLSGSMSKISALQATSVNKPHIKPTKASNMNKSKQAMDQHMTRKKTMSHHSDENAQGLVGVRMSQDGASAAHKKHRQPKQRVGASSKVSSGEKDSIKKEPVGKYTFPDE